MRTSRTLVLHGLQIEIGLQTLEHDRHAELSAQRLDIDLLDALASAVTDKLNTLYQPLVVPGIPVVCVECDRILGRLSVWADHQVLHLNDVAWRWPWDVLVARDNPKGGPMSCPACNRPVLWTFVADGGRIVAVMAALQDTPDRRQKLQRLIRSATVSTAQA